jgi:hypothetical protein
LFQLPPYSSLLSPLFFVVSGQGFEKNHQVALLVIDQSECPEFSITVGIVSAAGVVELNHVDERLHAAIVKVGCCDCQVAQARCSECPDIEELIRDQNAAQLLAAFLFGEFIDDGFRLVSAGSRGGLSRKAIELRMESGDAGIVVCKIGE